MRIVCLSDTHNLHDAIEVPGGDLLVHTGDFSGKGRPAEIAAFGVFLANLPHKHKVIIAGNHDFLFEEDIEQAKALLGDVTYLQDSGTEIDGLRIWGSPWQPRFFDWAFNLDRGLELKQKWDLIPDETELLLTHGPPHGTLDITTRGEAVGCEELTLALERVQPRVHVFGHIHEAYGVLSSDYGLSINACTCDVKYRPVNPPIVFDWIAGSVPSKST